jgi:hypothetical protein
MNTMTKSDMDTHVRILGWIYLVMSGLMLLGGVCMFFFMLTTGFLSGEAEAAGIMGIVAVVVGGMFLVFSLPGLAAGYGLLKRKSWARILAIIVGVLNITNVPIGTAVGIYTLYVLLQESASTYFA